MQRPEQPPQPPQARRRALASCPRAAVAARRGSCDERRHELRRERADARREEADGWTPASGIALLGRQSGAQSQLTALRLARRGGDERAFGAVKVESSQQLLEMRDFFALVHRDGCEERGGVQE